MLNWKIYGTPMTTNQNIADQYFQGLDKNTSKHSQDY